MAAGAAAGATPAWAQDDACLTADPPPVTRPATPLRFGITPQAAGSVGAAQGAVAPEDDGKALAALRDLRPPGKQLVMRLNRLFWADGDAGIARFAALVDRYAAAGFASEVQIRYHPPDGHEGDLAGWEAFVRAAIRTLARRPSVVAVSVTNEGNFPGSKNTSDGAYAGVVDALVRGVAAAGDELERLGRPDVDVGFTMMWRWSPQSDATFWKDIGAKATPAFRHALDYVGLQIYPGLVWPPAPRPGVSAGEEVAEALTLLRSCYLPKAALGRDVDLWVTENGYATNLGRTPDGQAASLASTVDAVHRFSGELGVTDLRYFNLRDNDSDGTDLFDAVGLLDDHYARKPAFAVLRDAIAAQGTAPAADAPAAPPPAAARPARRHGRLTARVRHGVVRGRLLGAGAVCRGTVRITMRGRRARTARLSRDCRFRARLGRLPRGTRVRVRFAGTGTLAPARAATPVR